MYPEFFFKTLNFQLAFYKVKFFYSDALSLPNYIIIKKQFEINRKDVF